MFKHFLCTLVLIVCSSIAYAAQEVVLKWTDPDAEAKRGVVLQHLSFAGCAYATDARTPVYYKVLQLPSYGSIRIRPLKTTVLSDVQMRLLDGSELPTDFTWTIHPFPAAGATAIALNLIPVRKIASGKAEALLSFEWEFIPGATLSGTSSSNVLSNKTRISAKSYTPLAQSVLSQGKWIKLSISKTGVYQLSFDQLKKWGFNLPQNVSVWGNQYAPLPVALTDSTPNDLKQYPTIVSDNKRILFYAQAQEVWSWNSSLNMFLHQRNEYDQQAYVYVTDGISPVRMQMNQEDLPEDVLELESDSYTYRDYKERYDTCLIASGRRWFGESFDLYTSRDYSFNIPKAIAGSQAKLRAVFAVRSGSTSTVQAYSGGTLLAQQVALGVNLDSKITEFAKEAVVNFTVPAASDAIAFTLKYQKPSGSLNAKAWLDYVVINARASLQILNDGQVLFRDLNTMLDRAVTEFKVKKVEAGGLAFDVSKPFDIKQLPIEIVGTEGKVKVRTDRLRELAVVNPAKLPTPVFVEAVKNQNIHSLSGINYLIVCHPSFASEAQTLAQWHKEKSGFNSKVITTEQIYNEFSAGLPDPTAIRNFLFNLKQNGQLPAYVLLFGDGSYVNLRGKSGASLVPTFQSLESLHMANSYMSDDYFGCLETGENMDINLGVPQYGLSTAIGRFPVNSTEQARIMVKKVQDYMQAPNAEWMSKWLFVADDEDANQHMAQANEMADSVVSGAPYFKVNKLFFDSYPQLSSPSGERYPQATEAINQAFNQGHLVSCYVGHANEYWIADEKVITLSDIQGWTNGSKMPLFITATCEFARFDTPSGMSAGEYVLLHKNGGSVALLSTTRLVYSHLNFALSQELYRRLLQTDAQGNYMSIGEAVRQAKNTCSTGINQLCFALLGDPALQLRMPQNRMSLDSINARSVPAVGDTLKALSRIRVAGSTHSTETMDVRFSIYDKKQQYSTLGNGGETPFLYEDRKSKLVNAQLESVSGRFSGKFILPKDMTPSYGKGLMTYWGYSAAQNAQRPIAGSFDGFILGGLDASQVDKDKTGPDIRLYMNDENFVPGGVVAPESKMLAVLTDSSGINISGNGIGRNLQLNVQPENVDYVLNEYFVSDKTNPNAGRIVYDLPKLSQGEHSLTLKVWDNYNNASEKNLSFRVSESEKFNLFHVLNYPNPFTEKTAFFFEHNGGMQSMQYLIQIYTISGKLVKTFRGMVSSSSRQGPIEWDGKDDFGNLLGRGVYFYKVKVSCIGGESAEKIQKLVILK